ncbi:hypothetical protein HMPREF9103_00795 [Lentilactobacillus parafarraginis F0439]|uniref:Uncharacterized protein n=1 Tax=Lentilactobacillus parafarraginis F0439 TaxID=797515 RepID=G9ZM47_9LACO|nr:hypothetical protein HMPREF9103_00795 [Lentilactobacillus parafarraginis F0439]
MLSVLYLELPFLSTIIAKLFCNYHQLTTPHRNAKIKLND